MDIRRYPAVIDALEWNALSPEFLLVRSLRTSYGYINHSTQPNVAIGPDGYTMRACLDLRRSSLDPFLQRVVGIRYDS